ncbi:MAG: hypothetical protein U5J98_05390 [Halobacteriales archaeon]|nr:hypothetical protein [Halobacteriales archaeon]
MSRPRRHPLLAFLVVVLLTLPWVGVRAAGAVSTLSTPAVIVLSGVAVIGAAFVLTWAAESAEMDVPRSFALAVLAVIAVAPEYAVDALLRLGGGPGPGDAGLGDGRQPRRRQHDRREPHPHRPGLVADRPVRHLPGPTGDR